MKKQIIYSGILAATILAATGAFVLNNSTTKAENKTENPVLAVSSPLALTQPLTSSRDETVYVITDSAGSASRTFINNTIYQGNDTLPVAVHVTYYLDGEEISASAISGKSGHVKIVVSYDSLATYDDTQIPFAAISGVILDGAKFHNVTISDGKTISDGSHLIAVGYAFPGLNENLGAELLSTAVTIEADTTGFSTSEIYTIFLNDLLANFDTSNLATAEGLIASVNQLSTGLDRIVSGASSMKDGLASLLTNSEQLAAGTEQLAAGLTELSSHNEALTSGAVSLYESVILPALNSTIADNDELLDAINAYQIGFPISLDNYATSIPAIANILTTKKTELESQLATLPADPAYDPARALISAGIEQVATSIAGLTGCQDFYDGLHSYIGSVALIASGANELASHMPALISGETELYNGSVRLAEGLDTFKSAGINRLVNFANSDLSNFIAGARRAVTAASHYTSFGNQTSDSVKFIFKTPTF